MRHLTLSPALIIIGSHDPQAAAALAYGLGDHFDDSMNKLTARFAQRQHTTPVINGYELDEFGVFEALKTALEQTVVIAAAKPGAIEWPEVLSALKPHCVPAVAPIMLTRGEFNSRQHDDAFADTLVLSQDTDLEQQKKFALTFLRHRRGEVARDPAAIFTKPTHPRVIRQDDFVPG